MLDYSQTAAVSRLKLECVRRAVRSLEGLMASKSQAENMEQLWLKVSAKCGEQVAVAGQSISDGRGSAVLAVAKK